jgi:GT2 family glycosyltransferase
MPSLSVIIVNYKSWAILRKNLTALVSCIFSDFEFEVIVVDNCSNDGHLEQFIIEFPNVKFIENIGNWGFAHGCNLGAKYAQGELFLFLNPDTLGSKTAIKAMVSHYLEDESIGIVSCRQSSKASSYQKIRPNIYTLFGFQRSIYKLIFKNKFKESTCKNCNHKFVSPDWISGSVVLISKALFERVGGWNTAYWMYSEDVELSIKVAALSSKLQLLSDLFISHEHGGSSRLNPVTTALTKTEVIISQHTYIQNNFSIIQKVPAHVLLICNTLIFKGILGLVGLLLFFVPKAKTQTLIFVNCLKYYFLAMKNRTWISPRSIQYGSNLN